MYDPFSWTASTICLARTVGLSRAQPYVRGLTHLLPRRDLRVVPDAGDVRHAARLRGDERGLGDEERARDARALRVVLGHELSRDVRAVRAEAREGCEDDTVAELNVADLDRLEERRGGCGGHRSRDGQTRLVMK